MKHLMIFVFAVVFYGCDKQSADFSSFSSPVGQGGSLARFTIVGNYLYTVDKQNLKVFNITNAANPVFTKLVPVGFEIETIYPFKDKLFIGSTTVVHIFSISDPTSPQKLSVAISPTIIRRCDPVVAKDSVALSLIHI